MSWSKVYDENNERGAGDCAESTEICLILVIKWRWAAKASEKVKQLRLSRNLGLGLWIISV